MWLLLGLVLWPLVEIGLFVTFGGKIGLSLTLFLVIASACLGGWIIRREGQRTQMALRQRFDRLSDPLSPMAAGAMNVVAGGLLILPGFLTDALGILLLLPPIRKIITVWVSKRISFSTSGGRSGFSPDSEQTGQPIVIDGEFIDLDANHATGNPDQSPQSGWTRNE
jgi:UPF0716 protein FxsA